MSGKTSMVAERLAWQMESWTSIEFTVEDDFSNHEATAGDRSTFDHAKFKHRYVETADGKRRSERYTPGPGARDKVYVHYFDGSKGASATHLDGLESKPLQIIIQPSFSVEGKAAGNARPYPLKYFYVGKVPLHHALSKAIYDGEARHLDRSCSVFLFPNTIWAYEPTLMVFTVDDATGVPVRVVSYKNESDRQADRPQWSWAAKTLDTVEGHTFPMHSQELVFSNRSGEAKAIGTTRDIKVTELKYNREYRAAEFWPAMQPEVNVFDMVKKSVYRTKDPKAKSDAGSSPQGNTVQATQPQHWTSAASTSLVGVGLLVTVMLLAIKTYYGRLEKTRAQR